MKIAAVSSRRRGACRPAAALLLLLLLAGCVPGFAPAGGAEARAHEATVAACRQRADEAYDLTHRAQIYRTESQANTPFSGNYQPGVPDRGLSDLYQRDQLVDDCVRNTGAEGDRAPPPAASATSPPGN